MVSERPEPSPLTWMGGERRLARRVGRPMREFLAIEAASGMSAKGMDLEQLRIEGSDEIKVLSPSTGVFYTTPSPSEPDYVAVNDVISTEDVLFQMEAMKMFTPITLKSFSGEGGELYPSDTQYQVTRINNVSGQQVNEGDLLFVLKPIRSVEAA